MWICQGSPTEQSSSGGCCQGQPRQNNAKYWVKAFAGGALARRLAMMGPGSHPVGFAGAVQACSHILLSIDNMTWMLMQSNSQP